MKNLWERLFIKVKSEGYRLFHKELWGKRVQINGIPRVTGRDALKIGYDVSINEKCYLQCGGG